MSNTPVPCTSVDIFLFSSIQVNCNLDDWVKFKNVTQSLATLCFIPATQSNNVAGGGGVVSVVCMQRQNGASAH